MQLKFARLAERFSSNARRKRQIAANIVPFCTCCKRKRQSRGVHYRRSRCTPLQPSAALSPAPSSARLSRFWSSRI